MNEDEKQKRLGIVRDAVAKATEGLSKPDYREFMSELISDADGWRMEQEEDSGDDDD